MKKNTISKLVENGWKVGTPTDFLGLTPEEAAYVECKAVLAQLLIKKRKSLHVTQAELAKMLGSSQSRVAKIEKAEPSVTIDLALRALFSFGVSPCEVGKALAVCH